MNVSQLTERTQLAHRLFLEQCARVLARQCCGDDRVQTRQIARRAALLCVDSRCDVVDGDADVTVVFAVARCS
jgi:hypothetical protein